MSQNIDEFISRVRSQFPDISATQIITLFQEETKLQLAKEETKKHPALNNNAFRWQMLEK